MRLNKNLLYILLMFLPMGVSAQLSRSALDCMLQNPKVTKTFENKKFGDHLFLQLGVGPTMAVENINNSFHSNPLGIKSGFMLGDWITPEHGVRLGFDAAVYNVFDRKYKLGMFSVDYLMNLSAISSPTYQSRNNFELYGVFGFDYILSRNKGKNESAFGGHIGVQTNFHVNDYFHIFLEPRISIFQDNYLHLDSWRGYRPSVSILGGIGYNLLSGEDRSHVEFPYNSLSEGWFFSFFGGASALVRNDVSSMSDYLGSKVAFGIGKNFTPFSAFRLSLDGQIFRRPNKSKMNGLGVQLDYIFNLTNTFSGYLPSNDLELNVIGGFDFIYSENGTEHSYVPGVGAGLQANYFLNNSHTLSFFLEPRIDLYNNDFLQGTSSLSKYDLTASFMMGLTFYNSQSNSIIRKTNQSFSNDSFIGHTFVQGALGLSSFTNNSLFYSNLNSIHTKAYASVGKWFSSSSGVRLFAEAARHKNSNKNSYSTAAIGADYLFNLSNVAYGYNPDRKFELISSFGINLLGYSGKTKLFLGGNAGVQALYHANDLLSFFVEPQVRFYGKYFDRITEDNGFNSILSCVIGTQLNINHFDIIRGQKQFKDRKNHNFLSVSGGLFFQPFYPNNSNYRGFLGRLSFGTWYNPISCWRINGLLSAKTQFSHYKIRGTFGADYLSDITSMVYGYDKYRVVSFRSILGADLALDYYLGNMYLTPEVHVGGQLGVRLSSSLEFYVEPQVAVDVIKQNFIGSKSNLISARIFAGLNYSFNESISKVESNNRKKKHFVSGAFGVGANTLTVASSHPFSRKYTFSEDFAYGEWFNDVSGWSIGIDNETLQVVSRRGSRGVVHYPNKNITGLQLSYLANINSFLNNGRFTGHMLQFVASAGITGNVETVRGHSPSFAPGLVAGIKMSLRLNDKFDIFLQPKVNIFSDRINYYKIHSFEANGKLLLGTSYHF